MLAMGDGKWQWIGVATVAGTWRVEQDMRWAEESFRGDNCSTVAIDGITDEHSSR